MAWLRDKTGLLSNPGIHPRVRADAIALAKINGDWMNAYRKSRLNDHIVRRYVATPTGVLRMFPGTLLSKAYNPLEQRWYTRALQHPGKVVFTGPYLDVGGAGYVVCYFCLDEISFRRDYKSCRIDVVRRCRSSSPNYGNFAMG